jgi:hypothetical protein
MCQCDFDPPNFTGTRHQRARKWYICRECGRKIEQGEVYRYTFAVYHGEETLHHRCCLGCEKGLEWLSDECGCWQYDTILQDLEEHFWDGHSSWYLGRLISSMKRRWTWRGGERMPIPVRA